MMGGMALPLQPILLAAAETAAAHDDTSSRMLGWFVCVALPLLFIGAFIWYLCALARHIRDTTTHQKRLESVLERIATALERKE